MRKQFLILLSLLPVAVFAQKGGSYTIDGRLSKAPVKAKIYLRYRLGQEVLDSGILSAGTFHLTGEVIKPVGATLILDRDGSGPYGVTQSDDILRVWLSADTITITGTDSLKSSIVNGSALNREFSEYRSYMMPADNKIDSLNQEAVLLLREKQHDTAYLAQFRERVGKAAQDKQVLQRRFIAGHPDSYFSFEAFKEITGRTTDTAVFGPLFRQLSPRLQGIDFSSYYLDLYRVARVTALGAVAPDFNREDSNGHRVSLSSTRGKYVLLDFWASWCGPCRAEMPNVVAAYRAFKNKNFTVFGVSLDQPITEAGGRAAMQQDGIAWTNLFDTGYTVSRLYGVMNIPANFLIDPTGKVIAKNLRGESLMNKLTEVLGR